MRDDERSMIVQNEDIYGPRVVVSMPPRSHSHRWTPCLPLLIVNGAFTAQQEWRCIAGGFGMAECDQPRRTGVAL